MTRFWKKLLAASLSAAFALAPAAQAVTPQQVKDLLDQYYIYDIPQKALDAETVEEIMAAIDDPYTMYLNAEQFNAFQASMADGTLVGIGVTGTITEEGMLLAGVYEGSPAEKLGLTAGDLILHVKGGPEHQTPEEISSLLRGEEGTEVTFLVRHGDGREESYTTRRAKVTIPATSTILLEDGTSALISCNTSSSREPRAMTMYPCGWWIFGKTRAATSTPPPRLWGSSLERVPWPICGTVPASLFPISLTRRRPPWLPPLSWSAP